MLQNDQTKLDTLYQIVQVQELARRQRALDKRSPTLVRSRTCRHSGSSARNAHEHAIATPA
jgi:hypothetical protein